MTTHLEIMFKEKGIDIDQDLDIEGQINLTTRNVLELIYNCPESIQQKIVNTFMKIDFANGNVMDFIIYLAKGMAKGF